MSVRCRVVADYPQDDDPYVQAAAYFGLTVNQADLCSGWKQVDGDISLPLADRAGGNQKMSSGPSVSFRSLYLPSFALWRAEPSVLISRPIVAPRPFWAGYIRHSSQTTAPSTISYTTLRSSSESAAPRRIANAGMRKSLLNSANATIAPTNAILTSNTLP